ncbi:hypothetical protein FB451DRAFT_1213965 [Mycena latifolia]|nr:hypothetical protein FB451DRAFT_1213965 [Mycena latifolia]
MAVNLPDEILSEILAPMLTVSEAAFADTSRNSPFVSNTESSSAVLLVCKAWLRVSTPLLYNVVVLRSKAQAQALEATLRKNADLGKFIKKLRVEGGFGSAMRGILKNASSVTDLFLSLHLRAADSPSGLVVGLQEINPRRLILHDDPTSLLNNKSVVQLTKALTSCAQKWTNLTVIVLPYRDVSATVREDFVKEICSSPTVKTISIPPLTTIDHVPPFLFDIANNPSIEKIEVDSPTERIIVAVHDEISAHPRLKSVVKWAMDWTFTPQTAPEIPVIQPTHSSFTPMASTPEAIVDAVWSRSLWFAMIAEQPQKHKLHVLDQYHFNQKVNSKRFPFLLVSKTFHRLALPLLYGYPLFADRFHPRRFSAKLKADPSLGFHLREMVTHKATLLGNYPLTGDVDLRPIFSSCPRLTHLISENAIPMQWDAFVALAETAGGALLEFTGYQIVGESPQPGDVLCHFTALRVLRWNSNITVLLENVGPSPAGLEALEVLELDSSLSLIFPALTRFALPELRRLVVHCGTLSYRSFLEEHGDKLTELVVRDPAVEGSSFLALCPNLRTMSLQFGQHYTNGLDCFPLISSQKHLSLEQVVIDKYPKRLKADEEMEWTQFFSSVDTSQFPALKEIRCPTCKWPTNEHAISKSFWVKNAEALLEHGIKLIDADGVSWRPRLKAARR